ncbi:HNH endonuclease [Mycobacterium sp. WMMD1722]|uniref:HNH endonuclease n=1 Tax=Mycobacterium sp. WMMD1722 TaxID=3404117 RepID=UPI003BF5EDB2
MLTGGSAHRRCVGAPSHRPGHETLSRLWFTTSHAQQKGAVWLDFPLAFVLDHIDGDPSNNRRENLVCPNCDSQLATYKGRNRGQGRHYRRQRYADGKSFLQSFTASTRPNLGTRCE